VTSSPPPALAVMPHTLTVVAHGLPSPQGSKRSVAAGVLVDQNPRALQTWREDVKLAAIRACEATPSWEKAYPAIVGYFTFAMPRPAHHHVGGDRLRELRDNAPALHATRPDLDKLLRSTWDALTTAGVWADDSRCAQAFIVKRYVGASSETLDLPGVRIVLTGVNR
jgi:Holliday junction resolvase RusA-like endonuclease